MNCMTYVLHYAPDNASLIVRLALEHRGLAYRTVLVDRSAQEQTSAAYRALNPNGLIPVLETPQGPLFETGAILLWLADRHGGLGPGPDDPARGDFLKWLFFAANTLHPALRMMFYPDKYIGADHIPALRDGLSRHLRQGFATLDNALAKAPPTKAPSVLDFYICGMLRWSVLYPQDANTGWFTSSDYPRLARIAAHVETLPCADRLQITEGLGKTPFTDPHPPNPPEGSAL